MKKQLLFFISFLFTLSMVMAQNSPIIVVSSTGKVSYANGTNMPTRIASGAVLDPNGVITLPAKTSAMIFCNGSYKKLATGKNSLKKICGSKENMRSLNVDTKVADFMVSAAQLALIANGHNSGWAKITDPKGVGGDGWGTSGGKDGWGTSGGKDGWGTSGGKDGWGTSGGKDGWGTSGGKDGWGTSGGKDGWGTSGGKDGWGTSGGKDGWGGVGKKIYLIMPIGKLVSQKTHFSWSRPGGTTSYKLQIFDQNKKEIHSVVVKDTFADIDLNKVVINHEEQYSWKVSSMENAESVSNEYQFAIESKDSRKAVLAKLNKSKIYATADATTRALMEAVVLEDDDWFYDVSQIFMQLKKKDASNNLVNMMHAAFWVRGYSFEMADAAVMP
jgi:hypothetical protein